MRLSSLSTSRSPAGLRLSEHCDIVAGLQEQVDSLASEIFVKLEPQAGRSTLERNLHKPFTAHFGAIGHTSQDVLAGKLWILFEYLLHRHAQREQVQDQGHPDPMPLMQGLPKQTLGSIEIFFSSSLRSITSDSARDSSLKAITLAGAWSRMEPNAWHFEIDPYPDGEKALRYNLREPVLGRGQVARHRVLVPGSQVRILPPQPRAARPPDVRR